jgi:peptide/nickel transport system permease protein
MEPKNTSLVKNISSLRSVLFFLRKNWQIAVGGIIAITFIGTAIVVEIAGLLGITVTPYHPLQQNVGPIIASPSWQHLFGTDLLGRDMLSRIVAATPNDVAIGIVVVAVSFIVGMTIGSLAAFKAGLLDELLMRFTDVIFALPSLVIAMVIAVALGPGVMNMMIALTMIWWPPYARLARGEALKVSHQNYIAAARISGTGTWRTIVKHAFPNIFTTMFVYATLDIGIVILVYAGFSYLGLSVKPPNPDWGEMVSSFQSYLISAPWLALIPGFIIAVGAAGFSLLGDGIRDALEVR